MTETRECAYEQCSETFTPKRPHQRFHSESCRYAQWELDKAREGASDSGQRVDGGLGTRGGNVRSVTEARQLQTASKALDRWRLAMEVQIHRTLLATGHFHIDDLDCLNLPAEAFKVRGTLVSSVRRSGVMRSTGVYRKVSHKAANGRPAPIYEITPEGRTELHKLVGDQDRIAGLDTENPEGQRPSTTAPSTGHDSSLRRDGAGSSIGVQSGEEVGPLPQQKSGPANPPATVAAGPSPDHGVLQLDEAKRPSSSMYDAWEAA
jgi:hypothetical protein